jgi:hypothetical protein
MKTTTLTALTVALAISPAFADPLDDIRSIFLSADPAGYWDRRFVERPISASVSPAEAMLQMDYLRLRRVARTAGAEFDRWLSRIPAGEVWRKHFESRSNPQLLTSEVKAHCTPPSESSPRRPHNGLCGNCPSAHAC